MRAALGRLQHGDYEAAAEAARRCFQANPNWSYYPHAACGDARETWKDRRGQRVGAAGSEAATRIFDHRHVRRLGAPRINREGAFPRLSAPLAYRCSGLH